MKTPKRTPSPNRKLRVLSAVVLAGVVLWQIVQTEMRVADLRSRGFTHVVIDSTRDHAYFPLIGGLLGAALFIGVGVAIKRTFRRKRD